jgi:hypothetical protein
MQYTAVYCVVYIPIHSLGWCINIRNIFVIFYLPEDGHICCRNIYEAIVHKNYLTSVNCFRIVTLYTLNARIMDDVKLRDFHVCGKGLASTMWGLNLLHHCGSVSTET